MLAGTRRRRAEARRRRPISRSARSCAPMRSTATRPSARKATKARARRSVTLAVADVAGGAQGLGRARRRSPTASCIARDLVNEPPNVLYPDEFARRAAELTKLGVEVEMLDVQGDEEARHGRAARRRPGLARGQPRRRSCAGTAARRATPPVAFIGKGVCFDTGGISIKPAAGMEDMKGDMAGAACVVGLMHALAARKAKVNAIGAIGLVENMPDGNAQRPGDIVTSMSGQTIEIINTDAEGRLVLADVLWYVQDALQAEIHGRSRDADRRDHRGARPGICRPVLQRRRAVRAPDRGRARRPASGCGACRSGPNTTS